MNEAQPLHIKWRPQILDDVIGQDAVVSNLKRLFEAKRVPHTFLFTGPSGTGKTTLGRIIAGMLECDPTLGVVEIDAALYSGIEACRNLIEKMQYSGLGSNPRRVVILDECHALSKAAWNTMLKSTEEPPAHLFWVFCTTEPDKVPKTLRTRAHAYDLKPVKWDLLSEFLEYVAKDEKLKVKSDFIQLAARKADGSVRQALVNLSLLDGIVSKDEALRLVEDAEAQGEGPIALARMIVSGRGFTWGTARKLLEDMQDVAPETIRITVLNYASAALMKAERDGEAMKLLAVVQAFSTPFAAQDKAAPLLLAVGSLLFQ
jgi:DNA polymerase III gamma/tau subunit